ncbi:hypothetical protein DPMN_065174 [Dreissena polymorpha]|uniref:Uncharacterized protein n=1 Tax=Dreissena polymorpha TaxID=45954 RepID=A0A9D4CF04_DREPO|nr:hypothetical protein DPMN_065174 [Dreissena polymorpha]
MMDVPNIMSEKVNKTALKRKRKSSLWLHQPKKTKFREENLPATVPSTSTSKSDSEAALCEKPDGGKESARVKPRQSGIATNNQALMYRKRRLNPGRLGEKREYQPLR